MKSMRQMIHPTLLATAPQSIGPSHGAQLSRRLIRYSQKAWPKIVSKLPKAANCFQNNFASRDLLRRHGGVYGGHEFACSHSSRLATATTRKMATTPSQPTNEVTCAVGANFRRPFVIIPSLGYAPAQLLRRNRRHPLIARRPFRFNNRFSHKLPIADGGLPVAFQSLVGVHVNFHEIAAKWQ